MSYTRQNFLNGMTLDDTHLINIENGILESMSSRKTVIHRNIHFVGMSIWAYDGTTLGSGVGGGVIARGYQTLIKEQFNFSSTINHCHSGHSLGGTSSEDTASLMNKTSNWTGSTGDIWTLDTITNDFKRNIPIGEVSDYENNTGITTYYGALRKFKDKVLELSGNTAIVICSNALRRNNANYTSISKNTCEHSLVDYEKALVRVAVLNNWYFVDQYRLSGVTDETIDLTTLDGLHLNNFGYKLAVKPWIEQLNIIASSVANYNIFSNAFIAGSVNSQGGLTTVGGNWRRTDYIEVEEGQVWKYTGNTTLSGGVSAVYGYDESKAPVSVILGSINSKDGTLFTIPLGIKYITCCSYHPNTNYNIEFMF